MMRGAGWGHSCVLRVAAMLVLGGVVAATLIRPARGVDPPTLSVEQLLERAAKERPANGGEEKPFDPYSSVDRERRVLEYLACAEPAAQVEMDMSLHDAALESSTFDRSGSSFLADDRRLKRRILAHFRGAPVEPGELRESVAALKRDVSIHEVYLSLPPAEATGSHAWHRAWIGVYRKWLEILEPDGANPGGAGG